jgi:26S proteasome regulatory subunit N10
LESYLWPAKGISEINSYSIIIRAYFFYLSNFRVDLLVSPTEDQGKILTAFSRLSIGGNSDLATSLQIAQLALKHRKNKNGGQRIIAFIGGPVTDSKETLTKIGKQLKKNNVAIDIVSFGEIEENSEKLAALVETTSSNDNRYS